MATKKIVGHRQRKGRSIGGTGPNKACRITTKRGDPRTLHDMVRRHLKEEGKTIWGDCARAWGCLPHTASRRFFGGYMFSPWHLEQIITMLNLDEFDALELRRQGAREAGWMIDGPEIPA
jgi:hypothetical protein